MLVNWGHSLQIKQLNTLVRKGNNKTYKIWTWTNENKKLLVIEKQCKIILILNSGFGAYRQMYEGYNAMLGRG